MEQTPSVEANSRSDGELLHQSSLPFMETEGSLHCSQKRATGLVNQIRVYTEVTAALT
jgi:hypothetical protein